MKSRRQSMTSLLGNDPLWYKDAILYELHVRAFRDSNGDGIGDMRGLVEKMDYLQDLGVTALWLLPFYPSPLRDDGYDIADYNEVNPIYGNLTDFRLVLREAHRRGLRVITELVINHTSDKHPWFQRARYAAPGSSWRDFYVWSDSPEKFRDVRIIFTDFEPSNWTWDPVAKAYYWHRFYSHQPDLNFDNPAVRQAVFDALDFWLGMDIDGLRLDAIPYLYEREGTSCENLPETHAFLKELRSHVDARFSNRMLLAEANQWPEDAVAYFGGGEGDECHMSFHFPLMPRLFMAIRQEDRFPIIDILQQTPAIPETSQWALFLRNHDELTLEMVTAEDRDYMYKVYAQDATARVNLGIRRRLAPLLENHRGKIELMNGLLFSLPGTPVLYYGDEIGMGDNIYLGDRNGVRTPMQWTPERNAGFSQTNPQRLYLPTIIDPDYHYNAINVETQQNNQHSLLWWMKRLIALRKRYQAFGRGSLEFLYPENHKVFAFLRRYKDEQILVVANLSRFVQAAELNLSAFKGMAPIEMLGRTQLPTIDERPYLITLGPFAFYWLLLEPAPARHTVTTATPTHVPQLETTGVWRSVFRAPTSERLEGPLLAYLSRQRWFAGKGGVPKSVRVIEHFPVPENGAQTALTLVQVDYTEGEAKTFVLPLAFTEVPAGEEGASKTPATVICKLTVQRGPGQETQTGVLFEPLEDKPFAQGLLDLFARHRRAHGLRGELTARTTSTNHRPRAGAESLETALVKAEQTNMSLIYGDRYLLKIFRWVEEGPHSEVEVARALQDKTSFANATRVIGTLEYRAGNAAPTTLAALQTFIPNEGDAFRYTLDAVHRWFEQVLTQPSADTELIMPKSPSIDAVAEEIPPGATAAIGAYVGFARLIAQRTAEMHIALASITDDPAFNAEPFTILYQRSTFQTVRTWVFRVFNLLRARLSELPDQTRALAQILLGRESDLVQHLRMILSRRIAAQRIRCHGDFHLGSLLYTGKDVVIIDFEGENLRPLSTRRHKRSPLRDVASMLYSFDFAARTALNAEHLRDEDRKKLEAHANFWQAWVSVTYVKAYLEAAGRQSFLPHSREEMQILLDFHLLGRGVFELCYQLLNHFKHTHIPLQALLRVMETQDRRRAPDAPTPIASQDGAALRMEKPTSAVAPPN